MIEKEGFINHRRAGEIFFHIFGKGIEVEGEENIPQSGPAIAVVNHMGPTEIVVPMLWLPEPATGDDQGRKLQNSFVRCSFKKIKIFSSSKR